MQLGQECLTKWSLREGVSAPETNMLMASLESRVFRNPGSALTVFDEMGPVIRAQRILRYERLFGTIAKTGWGGLFILLLTPQTEQSIL